MMVLYTDTDDLREERRELEAGNFEDNGAHAAHLLAWAADEIDRLQRPHDFPEIVCLCGSTRFMDAFFEAGWKLTLERCIVLSVGVCKHAEDHGGEALGQEVAEMLDELHLRKIDLCDRVMVFNCGGYIGKSTRAEIEYAEKIGKPVEYLEPIEVTR